MLTQAARGHRLAGLWGLVVLLACAQALASTSTLRGAYWESESFQNDVSSSYGVPQELALMRQQEAQAQRVRPSLLDQGDGRFHPTQLHAHARPSDLVREPAFVETMPVVKQHAGAPSAGPFAGAEGGPFGASAVRAPPQAKRIHAQHGRFDSPSFAEVVDQLKEAIKYPKGMQTDPRQPHMIHHRVGRPNVAPPADPPRPYDHPSFSGVLPVPRASPMRFRETGDAVNNAHFEDRLRAKSQQLSALEIASKAKETEAARVAAKERSQSKHKQKHKHNVPADPREALLEEFASVHSQAATKQHQPAKAAFELPPLVDVSDEDRHRAFHKLRRVD